MAGATVIVSDGSLSIDGNYKVTVTTSSSCNGPGAQPDYCKHIIQERKNSGSWITIAESDSTQNSYSITLDRSEGIYEYKAYVIVFDFPTSPGAPSVTQQESPVKQVTVAFPPPVPSSLLLPSTDPDGTYSFSWASVVGATRYEWQEKRDSDPWSANYSTTTTSVSRSGRTSAVWSYQVRACNSNGCSAYSSSVNVKVAIAPGVPTNIGAVLQEDGSILITWGASSGSVTAYDMDRMKTGSSYVNAYDGLGFGTLSKLGIGSYTFRVRGCKTVSGYKNCSGWRTSAVFVLTVGTVSYEYDELGRLIEVIDANNLQTNYQYDDADNRTNKTTEQLP